MKQIFLGLLFLLLCSCAYIASGSSDAPDSVSLAELQGCYYREWFNYTEDLFCHRICIQNDTAFFQTKSFIGKLSEDSLHFQTSSVRDQSSETVLVTFPTPAQDGYYPNNLKIGKAKSVYTALKGNRKLLEYDFIQYTNDGWDLCQESFF